MPKLWCCTTNGAATADVSKDAKPFVDACNPNKLIKEIIDEGDMTKKEAYAELKYDLEYYFEEMIDECYDCDINISEVCEVEVTYDYYDADYEEWDRDYDYLILYKASDKFYVMDDYM